MIIKPLIRYHGDLELRWLNEHYAHPQRGLRIKAQFLNYSDGLTIFEDLPFGMLTFLTPGLVVSHGEVQDARRSGKQSEVVLSDLSKPEEIGVMESIALSGYDLSGHGGGDQRVLRYQIGTKTILIPAIELIRFLFLHSRILADVLLQPLGLMELAVTPLPGFHKEIQIDFTGRMPRKLLTPEFVQEFAWLSIHPDGRRAWDSVRRLSGGKHFFSFDPPPLQDCRLEFRGLEWNQSWLVLEILSVTGRTLPAETIRWTHPSVYEKAHKSTTEIGSRSEGGAPSMSRPRREREHSVDGNAESHKNVDQDVVLLGRKRSCFCNSAEVVKALRPRENFVPGGIGGENERPHKTRSDAGLLIDPDLPPTVVRKNVSIGDPAWIGGLPPVEFAILEPAEWDHIGDLGLLDAALRRIEAAHQDFTLTQHLYFLKRGKRISFCGSHRRAYLLAVFTSPEFPPRVLIDVDHTNRDGLAGLLLRYDTPISLREVAGHVKIMLDSLVDSYGHWDSLIEARLSKVVTIKRLPKLLRMTERANDEEYVGRWVEKLNEELVLESYASAQRQLLFSFTP